MEGIIEPAVKEISYFNRPEHSNSDLGLFIKSPYKLFLAKQGLYTPDETEEKNLGTIAHKHLLEKDKFFNDYYIVKVSGPSSQQQKDFVAGVLSFGIIKEDMRGNCITVYETCYSCKNKSAAKVKEEAEKLFDDLWPYIESRIASNGKQLISVTDFDTVTKVEQSIEKHKAAYKLIVKQDEDEIHFEEIEIYWEKEGIKLRSKLDKVIFNTREKKITIPDIKTCSDLDVYKRSFRRFDYKRQCAFYKEALTYAIERGDFKDIIDSSNITFLLDWEIQCKHIVCEVDKAFEVRVFHINRMMLAEGEQTIATILKQLKWHIDNNLWEYTRSYYEGDGVEFFEDNF